MEGDFLIFSEGVQKHNLRGKLFKAFLAQLKKDCMLAGLNLKFSGKKEEVLWELKDQLDAMIHFGGSDAKISNLLYRIDIPENKLDEILSKTNVEMDHLSALCEVIAGRILQKVLMRMQYSGN